LEHETFGKLQDFRCRCRTSWVSRVPGGLPPGVGGHNLGRRLVSFLVFRVEDHGRNGETDDEDRQGAENHVPDEGAGLPEPRLISRDLSPKYPPQRCPHIHRCPPKP
jgi:hypothetical protein